MIERLSCRDFQCHERFDLQLAEGVTCITGRTDRGKSAVLRLLRWVATNEPSGDAFVRHGAESCKGILTVDAHKVLRERGEGVNVYKLDGKTFKAFGQSVPDDVARLLNLGAENFQGQHDAPLWFTLPAPQVSRELNAIINLDVIDETLANVAAECRRAKAAVEVSEERYAKAVTDRKRLRYVQQLDKDLQEIELIERALREKQATAVSLASLLREGESLQQTIDRSSQAGWEAFSTAEIDQADENLQSVCGRRDSLAELIDECSAIEERVAAVDAELADVETSLREWRTCPVCGGKMR